MVLITLAIFAISLLVLAKAADSVVSRTASLSRLAGISPLAVAAIIIAVGTSLPELAISLFSSAAAEPRLALGLLAGSSIANLTWIFGIAGFLTVIHFTKRDLDIAQFVLLGSVMAFFTLALAGANFALGIFGIIVFGFFLLAMKKMNYIMPVHEKRHCLAERSSADVCKSLVCKLIKTPALVANILTLIASIVLVVVSAHFIVQSAVALATAAGISEVVIAAVVISFGTTVPELSVAISAARRGNSSVIIGDAVGSVVANMGLIFGASLLISKTVSIGFAESVLLGMLLLITAVFLILSSKMKFGRVESTFLLVLYAAFIGVMLAAGVVG